MLKKRLTLLKVAWYLLDFYYLIARVGATNNGDGGFRDVEMFGEELDESCVGFAIVGFGAKINGELVRIKRENFFLGRAWFNGDGVFHVVIITCYEHVIMGE